jgi:hypothetical protein
MKQTHSMSLAIAIAAMTLLAGACTMRWPLQQESQVRPAPAPIVVEGDLPPVPVPTPITLTTEALVKLSTEEQMAAMVVPESDLRELAMRLIPDVGEVPLVVNQSTPAYEVGDHVEFWAQDMDDGRNFTVTAELIYKTNVAYAWVEVGQDFDREKLIETIDRFSEQSYGVERAFFGSEWKPGVDNDPRLHILHARGLGSYIAGYYSSSDEYSRIAQPTSNEKEMFYVDLDWVNSLPTSAGFTEYDLVLAHEFQHMIHWYTDMNEETWVGEGLSEFAQDVAGFGPTNTFSGAFLRSPDTQLDSWGEDSQGNDPHYGAAYLFFVYFAQRFGHDMTRALVAYPANGIDGINDILAWSGSDQRFDDVYADWVIANYVDDPDALELDGVYGYRDFDQEQPDIDESYDDYPTEVIDSTVYNYGTDYVRLEGRGDVVFRFQGDDTTQLANLPSANDTSSAQGSAQNSSWWSNRGDSSDMRLTRRFDLGGVAAGTPVQMAATMWWDIEEDYDYVYVSASRDGQNWTILGGESATSGEAVGAFGPGYTGNSGEWRTEHFDLSDFAGGETYVRFEYVTDDAINGRGLFLNNVTIPAIGYSSHFDQGDGWEGEGWVFTNNRLRQNWIVQVMTFDKEQLVNVQRVEVNERGSGSVAIPGLGRGHTAVVAISGAAPVILETASYEYWIDQP